MENRHGDQSQEFKRCGPVGVVQQLGVEHLTIVGKAGFFRDGTEFFNEVDEREWLWNSDTEADEYDEYAKRTQRLKEAEEGEEDPENEEVSVEERTRSEARDNGSNTQTSSRNATIERAEPRRPK
jgi:hypothetical protein